MYTKENEGVIRLGCSKSVRKYSKRSSQNSSQKNTARNFNKIDEPLQQSSINLQEVCKNDSQLKIYSNTQKGFFPRPSYVKENQEVMSATAGPSIFHEANRHVSPRMKVVKVISGPRQTEEECQLKRKLKILEGRVQELHQEKQIQRVRLGQQNRKLFQENCALKQNLSECQRVKQMEIEYLQRELRTLQELRKSEIEGNGVILGESQELGLRAQQTQSRSRLSLKNAIYVEQQKNQQHVDAKITDSIIHKNEQTVQLKIRNRELELELEESKKQISLIRHELEETKNVIQENSAIIQQNNSSIIQQYEQNIEHLVKENQGLRNNMASLGEQYQSQISQLEAQIQHESQTSQDKFKDMESTIQLLKAEIQRMGNEKQEQLNVLRVQNNEIRKSLQAKKNKQPESCQKCKELIRNLMKLNQKTLTKMSDSK